MGHEATEPMAAWRGGVVVRGGVAVRGGVVLRAGAKRAPSALQAPTKPSDDREATVCRKAGGGVMLRQPERATGEGPGPALYMPLCEAAT